jgi:hypothetical protein
MTDRDNLRKRVEEYCGGENPDLIRDLWAWGQELFEENGKIANTLGAENLKLRAAMEDAQAEANAWKHAHAFEPVTAEELTHALGNKPSFTLEVWVKAMLDELGPLYRQSKP